jgi:hypothetical protein
MPSASARYPDPKFAKTRPVSLRDFSGGMNNKTAPHLLAANELADVRNFHYDEKGTLTKRTGYAKRYAAAFATGPVRGLFNYRKEDGSSYLVAAADDKLWSEVIAPLATYDSQAEWETGARVDIDTTTTPGDIAITMPVATFTRATTAQKVDGTNVVSGAGRFETGRVVGAVTVEVGTTNLVKNSGAETNAILPWTTGAPAWSASATAPRTGTYCFYTAGHGTVVGSLDQEILGLTAGVTYVLSGWLKTTGTVTLKLDYHNAAHGTTGTANVTHNTATWTRKSVASVAPALTTHAHVRVESGVGVLTYYADDIQFEAKGYMSSNVPAVADVSTQGVRNAETLAVPTAYLITAAGTFESSVRLDRAPGTQSQYILDLGGAANANLVLYVDTAGKLVCVFGTGAAQVTITGGTALALATWYGAQVKWAAAGVTVLLNGISEGTSASVPALVPGVNAYLGSKADGTLQLDGRLDDVRLSNIARATADIKAAWDAGTALATDANTLFKLALDTTLAGTSAIAVWTATWTSPVVNASAAPDLLSGSIVRTLSAPAGTTVTITTRTSHDGIAGWSAYESLGAENSIVSPGEEYVQVKVVLLSTVYLTSPSVSLLKVIYDTGAVMTAIDDLLSTTARWCFVAQNDYLFACNGEDANLRWDGTTVTNQAGSPPICPVAIVHKNMMFLAGTATNRSRVYYSAIGDPESWPALNYIDVGRGDGDATTGFGSILDMLVVTKERSVWVLQGDGSASFVLRKTEDGVGAATQHSFASAKQSLAFLGRGGVRFFDTLRTALASEKIDPTIQGLNQRQLAKAAGIHFDNKYMLAVPNGTSSTNNLVLVFDTFRAAWTIYDGIAAGVWCLWRRAGRDVLIFGSATTGQIYEMDIGFDDDGAAIDAYAVLRALDFGAPEMLKLVRSLYLVAAEGNGLTTTAEVSFLKDLGTVFTTAVSVTVPAALGVLRVIPSTVGVSTVRTMAIKIRSAVLNRGLRVYALTQEYATKGVRAT